MRGNRRRHSSNYPEQNEEFNQNLYENYDEFDTVYEEDEGVPEEAESSSAVRVFKKIGKVALVILVLIALFFISMKITEICLDRNQEPASYGNDAPVYDEIDTPDDDTENVPVIEETDDEDVENKQPTYSEDIKETEDKKPAAPKPEEDKKPEENKKPEVAEKPETTEKPSTPETPSTPSKPVITPGNPAA